MSALLTVLVVLIIGYCIWHFGPEGWRTYIKGAVVTAIPVVGAVLQNIQGLDYSKVFDANTAWWILGAVGILIIIFNFLNKRLYGDQPV